MHDIVMQVLLNKLNKYLNEDKLNIAFYHGCMGYKSKLILGVSYRENHNSQRAML